MLILARRVGEKLIIGENVTVTVLGVKGSQVRIGIDAPRDVTVNREEIYERILKEQEALKDNGAVKTPTRTVKIPIRTAKLPARTAKLPTHTLSLSDKD